MAKRTAPRPKPEPKNKRTASRPAKPVKPEPQPKPVGRHPRSRTKSYEKEIDELVARGKKAGKLDAREVFALIPDTPANIDTLDHVYAVLAENDVELIAATEPDP